MSNNYVQEPPTTGKVILYTSHGELDIQLWTRETPLASRNFIQLCMEGFYDGTIFHRIIPSFMVQGGDPTGTGSGGESIYGAPFKDEFHQRLKFTHRGLVAMANSGHDTNKSQFFITFGECVHLNKKHTIFGKVVGNTMFNLMSMQSVDTDSNDRPVQPPYIKKTKVIVNPFDDIKLRNQVSKEEEALRQQKLKEEVRAKQQKQKQQKKEQTKKLKKKNLLSFEDDDEIKGVGEKIVSSHDALNDQRLSKEVVVTSQEIEAKQRMRDTEDKKKEELKASMAAAVASATQSAAAINIQNVSARIMEEMMRHRDAGPKIEDEVNNYGTRVNPTTGKTELYWGEEEQQEEEQAPSQQQIDDQRLRAVRQSQKKEFQAIRAEELRFKQSQEGSLNRQQKQQLAQEKTLLSNVERRRMDFIQKRQLEKHQGSMLDKLQKFRSKILHSKGEGVSDSNWSTHKLKFHIDSDNAYKYVSKVENARDYDDGGLQVIAEPETNLKRKGIDIDELYRLTKQSS